MATPKLVLVAVASVLSGLTAMMPVESLHSACALVTLVWPGTGAVGPTNFCRARITPPSRRSPSSLR